MVDAARPGALRIPFDRIVNTCRDRLRAPRRTGDDISAEVAADGETTRPRRRSRRHWCGHRRPVTRPPGCRRAALLPRPDHRGHRGRLASPRGRPVAPPLRAHAAARTLDAGDAKEPAMNDQTSKHACGRSTRRGERAGRGGSALAAAGCRGDPPDSDPSWPSVRPGSWPHPPRGTPCWSAVAWWRRAPAWFACRRWSRRSRSPRWLLSRRRPVSRQPRRS